MSFQTDPNSGLPYEYTPPTSTSPGGMSGGSSMSSFLTGGGNVLFSGLTAAGQAYIQNAQAKAQAKVANATMEYNKALTERRNKLKDYNARQQLNMVELEQLNTTYEAIKQKQQLSQEVLAAKSQQEVALNTMGASGKTRERLSKIVDTKAALTKASIETSLSKAQLDALFKRKDIEHARAQGRDYSLFIKQEAQTTNPLTAGLLASFQTGMENAAKLV